MAEASHYAFLYEVETFCPKLHRQVKLTLGSNIKQNGEIVKGKPISATTNMCVNGLENFPKAKPKDVS